MSQVRTCHEQTIRCIEETMKNFILAICSWDKSQYVLNKLPCSDEVTCAEVYLCQECNMEQRKDLKNNVYSLRNG
jgi:hypothetical protein